MTQRQSDLLKKRWTEARVCSYCGRKRLGTEFRMVPNWDTFDREPMEGAICQQCLDEEDYEYRRLHALADGY